MKKIKEPWRCPYCGYEFPAKSGREAHKARCTERPGQVALGIAPASSDNTDIAEEGHSGPDRE